MSDVDTCDMPLGDGRRCSLPGDHADGCISVTPDCLCGHGGFRHVAEKGRCRKPGCGCTANRPRGVAA